MPDQEQLVHVFVDFARRATGTFHIDALLRDLAAAAGRVLAVDGAGVAYRHGDQLAFVCASSDLVEDAERTQSTLQQGPCQDAAALGRLVVEEDLALHPERWPQFAEHALQLGLHAVASVPLVARGTVWGAMDLYRAAPGPFDPADLAAAQSLADVACSYVVMAFEHEQARTAQREAAHAATHDPLTGLPNRALLYDRLEHAVATAHRGGTPLALLFLDLDGFKDVNDTHGHSCGDKLLVQVASRLSGALRAGDTLARLGGDEFVIICEGLHPGPAGTVAEDSLSAVVDRVRAAVTTPVVVDGHRIVPAVSIGVATVADVVGADAERLLQAADRAMYEAKNRTGDRSRGTRTKGPEVVDLSSSKQDETSSPPTKTPSTSG